MWPEDLYFMHFEKGLNLFSIFTFSIFVMLIFNKKKQQQQKQKLLWIPAVTQSHISLVTVASILESQNIYQERKVSVHLKCHIVQDHPAAAAKSLQSDSVRPHRQQPPGSPVPGILQARTVEWVAISFSNARPSYSALKLTCQYMIIELPLTLPFWLNVDSKDRL